MSTPLEHGRSWYDMIKAHEGQPLILQPRDELDLANFVLDQVVKEAEGQQDGESVQQILRTIRDRSRSAESIIREIDKFIGRMGTRLQIVFWTNNRVIRG